MPEYNCAACTAAVSDYIDGELSGNALTSFEAHIASCPSCAAELARSRKVVEALRASAWDVPPALHQDIMARLNAEAEEQEEEPPENVSGAIILNGLVIPPEDTKKTPWIRTAIRWASTAAACLCVCVVLVAASMIGTSMMKTADKAAEPEVVNDSFKSFSLREPLPESNDAAAGSDNGIAKDNVAGERVVLDSDMSAADMPQDNDLTEERKESGVGGQEREECAAVKNDIIDSDNNGGLDAVAPPNGFSTHMLPEEDRLIQYPSVSVNDIAEQYLADYPDYCVSVRSIYISTVKIGDVEPVAVIDKDEYTVYVYPYNEAVDYQIASVLISSGYENYTDPEQESDESFILNVVLDQ